MLSQDSEDEIRSRFVFELAICLWQDELNPRVRCAFGNVYVHADILTFLSTASTTHQSFELNINWGKFPYNKVLIGHWENV